IRRIVDEGHVLGNHTVHHLHLPTLSDNEVETEIAGVEATVKKIFGASAPRMTLLRAPFGEPYQGADPTSPGPVADVVKKHGVHVGWALDEFDYNCPEGDGACVLKNFTDAIDGTVTGRGPAWGVVLMHSVHAATVKGLQKVIDWTKSNGYKLVTVED